MIKLFSKVHVCGYLELIFEVNLQALFEITDGITHLS